MSTSGAPPRRLLVVTADDFGLSEGICRGVVEAHRDGIVTATSALVLAPGFAAGVALAREHPLLSVGVHLTLVGEDPPISAAREIPTLVDKRGRLLAGWRQLLVRLVAGRVDRDDVRRELTAQVARARDTGIVPTHLDCHQHLHLWPAVGEEVIDLAHREGIAVVRSPRRVDRGTGRIYDRLGQRLADRIDEAGLCRTDTCVGWEDSGALDEPALLRTVRRLGSQEFDTAELMLHPGRGDIAARQRYRWNYRWDEELAAACSPSVRAAIDELGMTLAGPSGAVHHA